MSSRRSSSSSSSMSSSKSSSTSSKNIQKTIDLLLQSTEGDAKTILIIKKEIEGKLKIYKGRRIELEKRLKLLTDNKRLFDIRLFDDQESIDLLHRSQQRINDILHILNGVKELHRKAKRLIKSGDLHTKKGRDEIVEALDKVKDALYDAMITQRSYIRFVIEDLSYIENKRRERLSRTEVGRRLSLIKSKSGQQQPHLLKKRP